MPILRFSRLPGGSRCDLLPGAPLGVDQLAQRVIQIVRHGDRDQVAAWPSASQVESASRSSSARRWWILAEQELADDEKRREHDCSSKAVRLAVGWAAVTSD
jgi:hypothetical protein